MFCLYIKTHNKTGLKYLGYTTQNPHKYPGSGKRWKPHIKKHGKDISTEILLITEDKEELKQTGLFFSKLWNVVESDEWANFKPEEGSGGVDPIKHSEIMKRSNKERVENGTHHFLNSDIQRNIQHRRVKEGSHPFLTLAKERSAAGTHNWQGDNNPSRKQVKEGNHIFQDKEWSKKKAQQQVVRGTHSGLGKVKCVDRNGRFVQISKEDYYSQIGEKTDWEYVMMLSNEGRRRSLTPEEYTLYRENKSQKAKLANKTRVENGTHHFSRRIPQ